MPKIAISVVLLPPVEVMNRAITVNQQLNPQPHDIVLDVVGCLPHITLLMGCVEQSEISQATEKLKTIVQQFEPLNLTVEEVFVKSKPNGNVMSSYSIVKSAKLQALHETIVDQLMPDFSYQPTVEMFASPPPVDQLPNFWVQQGPQKKIREHYWPHITLGVGKATDNDLPFSFKASRLAICQLGIYCTCRKILAEVKLNGHG